MIVVCTSSYRAIWSSVREVTGGGTVTEEVSEAETAAGVGVGARAAIVEDGGARAIGGRTGLDAPASKNGFTGDEQGFGGRDGCKGELETLGVDNKAENEAAGGSTLGGSASVDAGAGVSCRAADSCKAAALACA
jgi:hypothetical protein